MSSRFAGSVLLLQEAVGVSFHKLKNSATPSKNPGLLVRMVLSNAAYSRRPGGIKVLLWTYSGIPPRHSSTVQHHMPAAVYTFYRWPRLEYIKGVEGGLVSSRMELAGAIRVLHSSKYYEHHDPTTSWTMFSNTEAVDLTFSTGCKVRSWELPDPRRVVPSWQSTFCDLWRLADVIMTTYCWNYVAE